MAELQRLSPPLWGLAKAARCRGDFDTAVRLCERGFQASAAVTDTAYLFPFLLTGTRARLAGGDVDAAAEWSDRVAAMVTARAIPGTLPAVGHSRGLILLATGDLPAATQALEQARADWQVQRRFWEGGWALLDLATAALRSRRPGAAATLLADASATAAAAGATALADAARRLADASRAGPAAEPWHPLSAREFEVARLVAAGRAEPRDRGAAHGGAEDRLGARHAHPGQARQAAGPRSRPGAPPSRTSPGPDQDRGPGRQAPDLAPAGTGGC